MTKRGVVAIGLTVFFLSLSFLSYALTEGDFWVSTRVSGLVLLIWASHAVWKWIFDPEHGKSLLGAFDHTPFTNVLAPILLLLIVAIGFYSLFKTL
jgi:hypothetical protein